MPLSRRRFVAIVGGFALAPGCANSRPIYVPRPRFDPARPERIGREPSRRLPMFRRRQAPMELQVDPPVVEEGEIRFEPADPGEPAFE